jgi:hypothetical protein
MRISRLGFRAGLFLLFALVAASGTGAHAGVRRARNVEIAAQVTLSVAVFEL